MPVSSRLAQDAVYLLDAWSKVNVAKRVFDRKTISEIFHYAIGVIEKTPDMAKTVSNRDDAASSSFVLNASQMSKP
ncbi:hypothetical protein SPRG_13261 [Saprolegnia parasitica CBS 223.65]|uniref:Uncharacterized protein n=1 Tax=Saprolegnia parasitica (strain CBS 223.65) TaxID=695850 RepID=A0A067BQM5_SAPPC|nr:hypothetical protein SPRG_13261 [Saprolegnia parasitica CBS 223.65]KDO20563.1 hypothetical protein SPRG_13261 [Saprolegnia parasitica CBS 223.65]|eukprot:XP_012208751.1 hypothetical protein SPRG_13261 [Saprolegnia parasitica CBS 223.65]